MKTFHLSQTITGLFLLTMCYLVQAKLECAVDERLNIALNTYSVEWPSVILLETENVTDENQCYEACCDFIEKGGKLFVFLSILKHILQTIFY